jgi:hypothetical protein
VQAVVSKDLYAYVPYVPITFVIISLFLSFSRRFTCFLFDNRQGLRDETENQKEKSQEKRIMKGQTGFAWTQAQTA